MLEDKAGDDKNVSFRSPVIKSKGKSLVDSGISIKRSKAIATTDFGAKISASVLDGFAFSDSISWNNYHEASDLKKQIVLYIITVMGFSRHRCMRIKFAVPEVTVNFVKSTVFALWTITRKAAKKNQQPTRNTIPSI